MVVLLIGLFIFFIQLRRGDWGRFGGLAAPPPPHINNNNNGEQAAAMADEVGNRKYEIPSTSNSPT